MPAQFTLPPDTRAVGTGNPPADVNAHTDALAAMGVTFNVLNAAYAGGADPTGAADSSAAFQACLDAARATATAGGGEMIIPPGTYTCNSTLHINGPVRIRGLGGAIGFVPATGGTAPTTVPAVTINSNNAAALFDFPSQGYLWGGLEMSGIAISFTGTGDVFSQPNITDSAFRDMSILLTASGSRAIFLSGSVSLLNVIHERCHFVTTNPVRTQPMISVSSVIGAGISNNTFFKCKFNNQGLDNTQYMVFFSCTGTGSAYHFADNFIECWFEHPFGGCYKSLSGSNIKIDGCIAWDVQTQQAGLATTVAAGSNGGTISAIATWASPSAHVLAVASTAGYPAAGQLNVAASGPTTALVTYTGISGNTFTGCAYVSGSPAGTVATGGAVTLSPTVGNSLWYHGAAASNAGSQGILITGTGRNLNGPDGGSQKWDVECESTTSNIQIQGYITSPVNPSTNYPVFFNFHNCLDAVLIGTQSPQGATVNGNSNTVITSPPAQLVNLTAGTVSTQSWQPADSQYLATNFDPAMISGGTVLTTGKVYLCRVKLQTGGTVTNIKVYINAAGGTLTTGQNFLGLYDSSGTRIAISADQTTNWASANTAPNVALAGGPYTLGAGSYYVAILTNGTTGVSIGSSNSKNATIVNGLVAAANYRFASYPTLAQTALPAGPITMSSNNSEQACLWVSLL